MLVFILYSDSHVSIQTQVKDPYNVHWFHIIYQTAIRGLALSVALVVYSLLLLQEHRAMNYFTVRL